MKNKMFIRKNDMVIVIAGRDRGKKGKVLKVFPNEYKAVVEKVNFVKEFVRANPQRNIQGGIMEKEAPIHISNLMIYCPECDRGVRVRKKILEDGSKVRICHRCGTALD